MKYKIALLIIVISLVSFNVTLAAPADTTADATISLSPSSGTYNYGNTFTIEVWVNDVTDLYGAEVFLSFDPSVLQVQDSNPVAPGVQVQPLNDLLSPDIVTHRSADNTLGTIEYVVTQADPAPAVSGSGAIMSFDMRAISPGETTIDITDFMLVAWVDGSTGVEEIPATASGGTYNINEAGIFFPIIMYNAYPAGITGVFLPVIAHNVTPRAATALYLPLKAKQ